MSETLMSLCVENISYRGKVGAYESTENLCTITHKFEFGKAYLLDSPEGGGSRALSWIIGGAITPQTGCIYLNERQVTAQELQKISWLVRHQSIKKFGIFEQSVKAQVRIGLKQHNLHSRSEDQIMEAFRLTPQRYGRLLRQFSTEGYRASSAIGFVHGRRIFCFPHVGYHPNFIATYRALWIEAMLRFLLSYGSLVVIPAEYDAAADGLFDDVVRLNNAT